LEVDYYEKKLNILKATTRMQELTILIMKINILQRSIIDQRQILIKLVEGSSYIVTFSSIYKLFQFLELYNFMQNSYNLAANIPVLARVGSSDSIKTPPKEPITVDNTPKNLRVLVLTFNMNRK
jgi:hypothetical protein